MAVTQDVTAASATAARRAATAAAVAANRAKAAGATKTPVSTPAPMATSVAARTATARTTTSLRTPVSTPAATPKPTSGTSASPGSRTPVNRVATKSATPSTTTTKPASTTAKPTMATTGSNATPVRRSAAPSRSTTPAPGSRPSTAPRTPSAPSVPPRTSSASKTPSAAPPRTPPAAMSRTTATGTASSTTSKKPAAAISSSTAVSPSPATGAAVTSRRAPATATARTTTSLRVPPTGPAAKPPAVGGRPPVNMTPTTIRTAVRTPSTNAPVKKDAAPSTPATPKTHSRVGSVTPSHSRAATAQVTSLAANRTSMASMSSRGGPSPAGSVRSLRTAATTPASPVELKKAISSVTIKYEELSMRLQAKEDELASLRRELDSGLFDNYAATETASSDGGETLVPELDLSKVAAQDKDVILAAIGAKEKEVARKKHQARTLKARVERLRSEHERQVKELALKDADRESTRSAELVSLHQQLSEWVKKHTDVVLLRQKLDETRTLHSTTIEELNRIHDDKLQSLGMELETFKRKPQHRYSGVGTGGVQERLKQDLEALKNTHSKELAQLLKEHQEEIDSVKAHFEVQKTTAVEEHKTELRGRFASELDQIKASHVSLLSDRSGAESGMTEVLQERHARALEELQAKTEKEHKQYLSGIHIKHQGEVSRLENRHKTRLGELESKIKKLQEKYDSDLVTVRSKADTHAEDRKKRHADDIAKHNEKHAAQLVASEASIKEKAQKDLDAMQTKFSAFVGDIQGSQDTAMKTMENGYETRIAELIVEHENRVQELEDEANEQVQQELERVEMEFELDRDRLADEQTKKLAELRATYEEAVEQLEEQLTNAEERAKEAIEATKRSKRTHEEEMDEVKADLEAQLTAVQISIEALITSQERDGKSRAQALQAGHGTIINTERSAHELALSEALAKKKNAWKNKNKRLSKDLKKIRDRLANTELERDKARSAMVTTETRLNEEYAAAVEGRHRDHHQRVEHSQEAAKTRLARVTKSHEEHAEMHVSKLADLLTSHHHELQALKDEQQVVLNAREKDNQKRVQTLEKSLQSLQKKTGGVSGGSDATAMLQAVQQAAQELAKLQKQNDVLRGENAQLQERMNQTSKFLSSR